MATSTYTFILNLDVSSDLTSAMKEVMFTPPSNLSGKLCYVQSTYFNWDFLTSPSPSLTSRDAFAVYCSWATPQSGTVTMDNNGSRTTETKTNLAFMNNNISTSTGPFLVSIPDGPHPVTFTVYRPDGGSISGSSDSTGLLTLCLKFVQANSRQPPIGA